MYFIMIVGRVSIVQTQQNKDAWCFRLTFMRHGRYIVTDVTKNWPLAFSAHKWSCYHFLFPVGCTLRNGAACWKNAGPVRQGRYSWLVSDLRCESSQFILWWLHILVSISFCSVSLVVALNTCKKDHWQRKGGKGRVYLWKAWNIRLGRNGQLLLALWSKTYGFNFCEPPRVCFVGLRWLHQSKIMLSCMFWHRARKTAW